MRSGILIYQDYIHNNALLLKAAQRFGQSVSYCDAADIAGGILNDSVALFIMPGGADLYYCEKLNGAGNSAIRSYVENGGSYLGICAGAYYACSTIEWAKGTDQEIIGPRELKFHDGTAIGPVMEFIQEKDISKSWLGAPILAYDDDILKIDSKTAYEAGPVFSDGSSRILARYMNGGAAIIECMVGHGRAILSSSHIERIMPDAAHGLYNLHNKNHDHDEKIYNDLAADSSKQDKIWNHVIHYLIDHHQN